MAFFPISVHIFKQCLFMYLFLTSEKLRGKVSEYNRIRILSPRPSLISYKKNEQIMTIFIYTPHQALANTWWLCKVKSDALSIYLQVQNHLTEALFLIRNLNGITFYHLSYSVFKHLNSTEACWNVHLQIVSRLARSSNKPSQ